MPTINSGSQYTEGVEPGNSITVIVPAGASALVHRTGPTGIITTFSVGPSSTRTFGPWNQHCRFRITAIGAPCAFTESIADIEMGASIATDPTTGLPSGLVNDYGTIPLLGAGSVVPISANITITSANASTYNGATLVWSAAYTVTLSAGLPSSFGFTGRPPASGNASVAVTGGPTIDGATTTITRTLASNKLFAIVGVGSDTYAATGT